jgi:hypothetical protein
MKTTIIGTVSVGIAALALAACASSGAATSTGKVDAKPAAVTAQTAKVGDGYQLVKKDGQDFYCRTDRATGSRARVVQTCLTKEQLDAQQRGTDALVQRLGTTLPADQQVDSNGGRYNNVMTQ